MRVIQSVRHKDGQRALPYSSRIADLRSGQELKKAWTDLKNNPMIVRKEDGEFNEPSIIFVKIFIATLTYQNFASKFLPFHQFSSNQSQLDTLGASYP